MCSCKLYQYPTITTWRKATHKFCCHRAPLVAHQWVVLHNSWCHKMVKHKKIFTLANMVKVLLAKQQHSKVFADRFQEWFCGCKPTIQNFVTIGLCSNIHRWLTGEEHVEHPPFMWHSESTHPVFLWSQQVTSTNLTCVHSLWSTLIW